VDVACIGTGAMGTAIAERLLDRGFAVRAFDVDSARSRPLAASGARITGSPADAAEGAAVALLTVATPAQLCEAVLGAGGVAEALRRGGIVAVLATVGVEAMRALETELASRGLAVLDAPVSGGPARARAGMLVVMAGGDRGCYETVVPVLDALASTVVHCGPVGAGQALKLVNQLLAGVHVAVAAEALAFAQASGVDTQVALDALTRGAATSFMLEDRGPRMLERSFVPTGATVDIFVKDLGLVLSAARDAGFEPRFAEIARTAFAEAARRGLGGLDDSAVIEVFDRL
jgi:3-hydroxyisobutyrate dehydrogenase